MICNKCSSENIQVQRVSTQRRKKKGLGYWLLFGWLIDLMLWIFLTLPRLIWAIFKPKETVYHSEAVCQSCGNSWKV